MNLPPFIKEKFKAAETVEELKAVIADILDEYNFVILSQLEERINKLEMTKWQYFFHNCGKYFRVRLGIQQRELEDD